MVKVKLNKEEVKEVLLEELEKIQEAGAPWFDEDQVQCFLDDFDDDALFYVFVGNHSISVLDEHNRETYLELQTAKVI